VLRDADAADVFQATFLVLAGKAAAVRWRPTVGPWLYAVGGPAGAEGAGPSRSSEPERQRGCIGQPPSLTLGL
jgi:hypothetical protein